MQMKWTYFLIDILTGNVTPEGRLDQHKRAVHEGIKYPCMQCVYQATYKSHLAEHRRRVYEGGKYPFI